MLSKDLPTFRMPHWLAWSILVMLTAACGRPSSTDTPAARNSTVQMMPPAPAMDPSLPMQPHAPEPATQFPTAAEHTQAELTYRIIDAPNGTYGYDILSDGRLFVHQTNLPGLPGNEGCRTKADAETLAAFVIAKIQRGEMPPSVTTEELDSLKIR
jgi:hypothetical protein